MRPTKEKGTASWRVFSSRAGRASSARSTTARTPAITSRSLPTGAAASSASAASSFTYVLVAATAFSVPRVHRHEELRCAGERGLHVVREGERPSAAGAGALDVGDDVGRPAGLPERDHEEEDIFAGSFLGDG